MKISLYRAKNRSVHTKKETGKADADLRAALNGMQQANWKLGKIAKALKDGPGSNNGNKPKGKQ